MQNGIRQQKIQQLQIIKHSVDANNYRKWMNLHGSADWKNHDDTVFENFSDYCNIYNLSIPELDNTKS